jgi:hypothetical protein
MANIMAPITNATTTNEMMRLISATSYSLATPAGLLLPSIEAGGDEFPMNFAPFSALFLAKFREFYKGEVRRISIPRTRVNKAYRRERTGTL